MVLYGESVVDMSRTFFGDRTAVEAFLRLCTFDTDNPLDILRLRELHHEAVVYLTDVHRYRLPLRIEQPQEIHSVFLAAGSPQMGPEQRFACMTLKVMHIMHHLSGRELLFNTAISEAQLFDRLTNRVFGVIDKMRAAGIRVNEFAAGKKGRTSLISKLLAKRNNLATHIFDKLRFRIVVGSRRELALTLMYLLRHLVPFTYVMPEQSRNNLLGPDDLAAAFDRAPQNFFAEWQGMATSLPVVRPPENEFSADTYRCINFVADIPLRIDDVAAGAAPAIGFVQTEIQLVDAEAARINERGDSSHSLYKKRQRARVRYRLENLGLLATEGDERPDA